MKFTLRRSVCFSQNDAAAILNNAYMVQSLDFNIAELCDYQVILH